MTLNISIQVDGDWSESPLEGVVALRAASEQVDRQLWSAIGQAKMAGSTWEDIGRAMGLSKQTVFERYAPAVKNSEKELNQFLIDTKPGETVPGTVASIVKFGLFVEVAPGVEGLVHESESNRPLDSFTVGDKVDVTLERFHLEKRRVALSIK